MIVCGDVHGKIEEYKNLIKNEEWSLQIGDMGFDYTPLNELSDNHRFLPGNHDNYTTQHRLMLGDYGVWRNIFYIRGAYSIDRDYRIPGVNWWYEEELDYATANEAFDFYKKTKPKIVATHTAPFSAILAMRMRPIQSRTVQLLEACFQAHQPNLWLFGHFHRSWTETISKTQFVCLNELETYNVR